MKTIVLAIATCLMVGNGTVNAQSSGGISPALRQSPEIVVTPEFQMNMSFTQPTYIHGDGRRIGYDPTASDSIDDKYGEADYPGSDGGLFPDFFFEPPTKPYYYGPVMILHKPSDAAFTLDFKMHIAATEFGNPHYQPTLHWDRSNIPSVIKGMYVTPSDDTTHLLVDLLKADSITIPIRLVDTWRRTRIRLYYNETPPTLPLLGVSQLPLSTGLLQNAIVTPNPSISQSVLSFSSSAEGLLTIRAFDLAGRERLTINTELRTGENVIHLDELNGVRGALLLHIEASSGGAIESKNVMVTRF